ncbi:MAG: Crp/Fnr family transcriptional regulator [Bacteroidota bacterium]
MLIDYIINGKRIKLPNIDVLTREEIQVLQEHSSLVSYHKKDVVFRQGTRTSHVMLVTEGLVKIYKLGKNGKTVMLKLAGPGEFIGMMSIFGDTIHQYSAMSIMSSEVLFIDFPIFNNVIKNNGEFALKIIGDLSKNGLYIFQKLICQAHKQLPGRVADVLLYFMEVIYKDEKFEMPLTRKELAELAGTTKESFIRTLSEFKNDKIIEMDGTKIEIKSPDIVRVLSQLG